MRQKAKPKHAVTPERVEEDMRWLIPNVPESSSAGCGLSGLPAGTCQSYYEWSPLAVLSDGASAVKQMLPSSITDSI